MRPYRPGTDPGSAAAERTDAERTGGADDMDDLGGTRRPGTGTAFGTFGELLQGELPEENGDFLVTLPVARWTRAVFRPGPRASPWTVGPPHKTKALTLARLIAEEAGRRPEDGGRLTLSSMIPEGKGLASSSADLVATARAVGLALDAPMPARRIERLLARIEPTDGVLYPAIVAFHHRTVRLRSVLGSLPPMGIVGVDEGGAVDTVDFNRSPKPFTPADRREYARLLEGMSDAVRARDLAAVGRIATRSALMNQPLRHKWSLEPMCEICRTVGGLGVTVGHSGTTAGILLDAGDPSYTRRVSAAARAAEELAGGVSVYRTLSFHGRSQERTAARAHPFPDSPDARGLPAVAWTPAPA